MSAGSWKVPVQIFATTAYYRRRCLHSPTQLSVYPIRHAGIEDFDNLRRQYSFTGVVEILNKKGEERFDRNDESLFEVSSEC